MHKSRLFHKIKAAYFIYIVLNHLKPNEMHNVFWAWQNLKLVDQQRAPAKNRMCDPTFLGIASKFFPVATLMTELSGGFPRRETLFKQGNGQFKG